MVHTALLLLGMALVLLLQQAGLLILPRLQVSRDRQRLRLLILALPPLMLALFAVDIGVMVWRGCIHNWTVPDAWASGLLIGVWATLAAQATGRLVLRQRMLAADLAMLPRAPADYAQQLAATLAQQLSLKAVPAVTVYQVDSPLAATVGWRRPRVILSTWLLEHLSARELEAVVAHELVHAHSRDPLWLALGGWSRRCAGSFPAVRRAWADLLAEQERDVDAQAVALTHRPASLASALLKCWEGIAAGPLAAPAVSFADGHADDIEARIRCLLQDSGGQECAAPLLGRWGLTGLALGLALLALSPLLLMPSGLLFSCQFMN